MSELSQEDIRNLLQKYKGKLEKHLDAELETAPREIFSREYQDFKKEQMPKQLTWYEKMCNGSEKLVKIKPKPDVAQKLQESINISHIDVTPTGVTSFSILGPLAFILITILLSLVFFQGYFFVIISLVIGLILINILANLPNLVANSWRMKASNQMVLSIFYIVTYMRHTSNLENAINFAAEHLAPPLSLDLKKVLWDVETRTYDSIKVSLDAYLESWRKWNIEFIEAFHLIESSLYEPSEARRVELLDKALDVMLEETYEKMLHYAQNLKSPITMLHMLGIVMPILGLVVLPLVVSFMEGVQWYHLFALYNILLPLGIYYLARNILSNRPTGYGDTDISEQHPEFKKYKNVNFNFLGMNIGVNPIWLSVFIFGLFLFIGLIPILSHLIFPNLDYGFGRDDPNSVCGKAFCMFEYRPSKANPDVLIGPYGLGASILSLFITLSLGYSLGMYFKLRSENVIKIREKSKELEKEFASALFQLGNRIGDGIPAELAFDRVADSMKETISGSFFEIVSTNIKRLGMSVKDAIFNMKTGAILYYPSNVIQSSMKVLIVSIKKGPQVAAQALVNVARYIQEIHRVDERLKDLMSDIISSMQSQIRFLAPAVSGIVIGITAMITMILGKLGGLFNQTTAGSEVSNVSTFGNLFGDGVPTYYFQLVVGIYIVQIIYILTLVTNGIENGADKLSERYMLGINLTKSIVLYCIICLIVMVLFSFVAGQVLLAQPGG